VPFGGTVLASAFRHDSDFNQAFASSVNVGSPNDRFAPLFRRVGMV
jgi:hypothetical protein